MRDKKDFIIGALSAWLTMLLIVTLIFSVELRPRWWGNSANIEQSGTNAKTTSATNWEEKLFPKQGTALPIVWGDLGKKLTEFGVIDEKEFQSLYSKRGTLGESEKQLLLGEKNDTVAITQKNASFLLNLFWAFGLSNKNEILEQGPMMDKRYGGAGNFASTGGWTMSKGEPMNHYSAHTLVKLTRQQQELVKKVSRNIFRPCCDNSTYFPDCNHGMAMLGFLQLMASRDANEEDMYKSALQLNTYWFPAAYATMAEYLEKSGTAWEKVDPKVLLSAQYSSSSGYRRILSEAMPVQTGGGGPSCGV